MTIEHLLNRTFAHWRRTDTATGTGGFTSAWAELGDVAARVSQPTDTERVAAAQHESRHTHTIYLAPDAEVRRGDELRDGTDVYEIVATFAPSVAIYLRAEAHLTQHEGD